jgi:hypothetical protein
MSTPDAINRRRIVAEEWLVAAVGLSLYMFITGT